MSFSIGALTVLGIGAVSLATLALVVYHLRKYRLDLTKVEKHGPLAFRFRTKYAERSVVQHRHRFLGIGLICSLTFALVALNWTSYDISDYQDDIDYVVDDILEVEPPRTDVPPPTPPPPPPLIELEIVEDELIKEDDVPFFDPSIDEDDPIEDAPIVKSPVEYIPTPLPPLPEEDNSDIDEIRSIVEHMPLFGGCEDRQCSDQTLMKFIYQNIKYPTIARENGIEGRVTAEFVVEKDGSMSGIKILRGIGGGCDEEVVKVLNKIEDGQWKPGRQGIQKVRVLYRLPITFELNH